MKKKLGYTLDTHFQSLGYSGIQYLQVLGYTLSPGLPHTQVGPGWSLQETVAEW